MIISCSCKMNPQRTYRRYQLFFSGGDDNRAGDASLVEADEENDDSTKPQVVRFNYNEMMPKQAIVKMNDINNGHKPLFLLHPIEGKSLDLSSSHVLSHKFLYHLLSLA